MRLAIHEAKQAGLGGDVPVGAVLVCDEKVVCKTQNQRQRLLDPTAHAEVLALRKGASFFNSWHIEGTLYVTQEPCTMCAGALVNARVKRVVYGCKSPKSGAVHSLYQITEDKRLNHQPEVLGGVLEEECSKVLSDFFEGIRKSKKEQK